MSDSEQKSFSCLLGFPRFGSDRQLKTALESYWNGGSSAEGLLDTAAGLRGDHWRLLKEKGVDIIPSNDFSLYDHVLDAAFLFNAIPKRYREYTNQAVSLINNNNNNSANTALLTYFAMARGAISSSSLPGVSAMEMKKWFDTNYHYIVPEFEKHQSFAINHHNDTIKPLVEFNEAKAMGIHTRPVLLGPISFLLLGKWEQNAAPAPADHSSCSTTTTTSNNPLDLLSLLDSLLPAYLNVISLLKSAGATSIQIDEPILVTDMIDEKSFDAYYRPTYSALSKTGVDIVLTTYFGHVGNNLSGLLSLPIKGIHFDLIRGGPKAAPKAFQSLIEYINAGNIIPDVLSLGVINGRNIWKANIREIFDTIIHPIRGALTNANRTTSTILIISSSCSLLHTPHSLAAETKMDTGIKSWLAFATEKITEIVTITKGVNQGIEAIDNEIKESDSIVINRSTSPFVLNQEVRSHLSSITPLMFHRSSPHSLRNSLQQKQLNLPLFPTTTIGSFPQTPEVRKMRSQYRSAKISKSDYDSFIQSTIKSNIDIQESIGLDVFVHGEPERTDMVEFFGELLGGFLFTQYGWVQSYGSRCVKPPVIYGDVYRSKPMTVELAKYSQSLTKKPVKGMLTAPITILQWSFVRDDQHRSTTAQQIALAIRDEVQDLENAGINVIQLDEPAIREGLPLRKTEWNDYLKWAVDSFLLSSCGVRDSTQIHTHMCYSDFQDIFDAIVRMDADVITIENARSDLKLLQAFKQITYPNRIAPGLYDIHSPRIPTAQEMLYRANLLLKYIPPQQLEIVPDCGLKTRKWDEVIPALNNLVAVAKALREQYNNKC